MNIQENTQQCIGKHSSQGRVNTNTYLWGVLLWNLVWSLHCQVWIFALDHMNPAKTAKSRHDLASEAKWAAGALLQKGHWLDSRGVLNALDF